MSKRRGVSFLLTDPQIKLIHTNKTVFFDEIYFTLNKILGKYGSILPVGD